MKTAPFSVFGRPAHSHAAARSIAARRGRRDATRRGSMRPHLESMALEARVVMSTIPTLNSLAGAAATLYLDFDGHYQSSWGSYSNINTPAYDQDGNPSSFSEAEVGSIRQIWEYVAEDYAPFNINVSTVEPTSFNNGQALRVAIGGDSSWMGGSYGGYAYYDSFTNSIPNVVYVFPKNLGNGAPKYVGEASSHESGHGFGLRHQGKYSGGSLVEEYSTGTDGNQTAPIMGNSYYARRGLWWNGTTTSASTYQDDMAVISRSTNGFGYRPDDHGNSAGAATPLTVSGTAAAGAGIIATTSDLDVFSFSTGGGDVSVTVRTPANVNNLAPRLELRDAGGSTVIASAGPASDFTATIGANLAAGSYRLVVASDGVYGSVGQYSVGGTIVASTSLLNPPSGLSASTISTSQINLSWSDNASNETGYRVERTTDGVTWTVLAGALPSGSTSYSDTSAAAGTTYSYRVGAFNTSATSDYSNTATTATITVAPGGLTASAASSSRVDLSWSDVGGETGYRVERSTDGVTWAQVGTTGAGVTTFSDTGRSAGTTYSYRVQAVNAGGASAFSNTASATTSQAPSLPDSPTGLTAAIGTNRVTLTWTDVSGETGYRVERSTNGGKGWSTIGQVGTDVTTFTDTNVRGGKSYVYRVSAFNGTGESPPSAWISVSFPGSGGGGKGGGNGAGGGKGSGASHGPALGQTAPASARASITPAPVFVPWADTWSTPSPARRQPIATTGHSTPAELIDSALDDASPRRRDAAIDPDHLWWALD